MVAQRKGDYFSVTIDDELIQQEVNLLQNTLIGRISMASRDSPYTIEELRLKLEHSCGISGDWDLVPLGKGYYNIRLPHVADRDMILDKRI